MAVLSTNEGEVQPEWEESQQDEGRSTDRYFNVFKVYMTQKHTLSSDFSQIALSS